MFSIPTLYTPRLVLRPFTAADAPRVRQLAGDKRIADTTARIPHPYPEGAAESFIAAQPARAENGTYVFAVTLAGTRTPGREHDLTDTGHLVGAVGLERADPEAEVAECGYWIGVHYWNKGFATEALRALLTFAFQRQRLHRVEAAHFAENTASGRVLQKLGMLREGIRRQAFQKNGQWLDLVQYALLADEWTAGQRRSARAAHTPASRAHVVTA
jgi:RimJ/RimL family protein N-acetyltransferase